MGVSVYWSPEWDENLCLYVCETKGRSGTKVPRLDIYSCIILN